MVLLWTTTFLDGPDGTRLERTKKWLDYYIPLKEVLGFDRILLVDNASSVDNISSLLLAYPDVDLMRFGASLVSKHALDYPYCWRALYWSRCLTARYDKLIFIDNDGFVLSTKCAEWIKSLNSGWNAVWCKRHNFPETILNVVCRDAFPRYLEFTVGDYMEHNGKMMETILPFTNVNKTLNCDRFGEVRATPVSGMDFYAQCPVDIPMTYGIGD